MKKAVIALLFVFCTVCVQHASTKLSMNKVAGNVYQILGAGGNIGALMGPDSVLLVDTGDKPVAPEIKQAIATVSNKPIHEIIITHYHYDHVASISQLSSDAVVISHENARKSLAKDKKLTAVNGVYSPADSAILPRLTFQDSMTLHFPSEDVQVWHFPNAHTAGDAVVYFTKSNVVHMGDILFSGMFPYVDVEDGGNVLGMAEAVEKVLTLVPPDAKFIAGHGPVYTADQMRQYSAFLKDSAAMVDAAMKQGKTLKQIQSEGVLEKYDRFSNFVPTPLFTEFVYKSLQARSAK